MKEKKGIRINLAELEKERLEQNEMSKLSGSGESDVTTSVCTCTSNTPKSNAHRQN